MAPAVEETVLAVERAAHLGAFVVVLWDWVGVERRAMEDAVTETTVQVVSVAAGMLARAA